MTISNAKVIQWERVWFSVDYCHSYLHRHAFAPRLAGPISKLV